jgi:hypothetical protein
MGCSGLMGIGTHQIDTATYLQTNFILKRWNRKSTVTLKLNLKLRDIKCVFHHIHESVLQLSLCLTKNHAMKMYWGNGGIAPCILDLGIRWR